MTMKDKYITYKVQDYKSAFFATMLLGKLCVRVEILLVFGEYKTNVVKIHLMIIYQCIQVDPKQFHIFQICFTLEAILDFWSGWKILLRTIQWLFMYNLDSNSSLFSKENILRLWQSSWIYFICTKNTYCTIEYSRYDSISSTF
jgi:hypothetical protein